MFQAGCRILRDLDAHSTESGGETTKIAAGHRRAAGSQRRAPAEGLFDKIWRSAVGRRDRRDGRCVGGLSWGRQHRPQRAARAAPPTHVAVCPGTGRRPYL
ncbi:hypothetical protein Ari01nite_18930 [Paractinoplanes rishiriensis]|uniref:Uncharacterized protein n=1 Tax=Paractinoplanes rishiriensis TaxID=1050105 RepID=A0A919JWI7_9ACTN|nr:hypothetical protein Ari01nite_18930 [Actinoplanes rishiriensis]